MRPSSGPAPGHEPEAGRANADPRSTFATSKLSLRREVLWFEWNRHPGELSPRPLTYTTRRPGRAPLARRGPIRDGRLFIDLAALVAWIARGRARSAGCRAPSRPMRSRGSTRRSTPRGRAEAAPRARPPDDEPHHGRRNDALIAADGQGHLRPRGARRRDVDERPACGRSRCTCRRFVRQSARRRPSPWSRSPPGSRAARSPIATSVPKHPLARGRKFGGSSRARRGARRARSRGPKRFRATTRAAFGS